MYQPTAQGPRHRLGRARLGRVGTACQQDRKRQQPYIHSSTPMATKVITSEAIMIGGVFGGSTLGGLQQSSALFGGGLSGQSLIATLRNTPYFGLSGAVLKGDPLHGEKTQEQEGDEEQHGTAHGNDLSARLARARGFDGSYVCGSRFERQRAMRRRV